MPGQQFVLLNFDIFARPLDKQGYIAVALVCILLMCMGDHWRRKWQLTPVFLPGESHGQSCLAGYSPWRCKESDTTEVTPLARVTIYLYF